VASLQQLVSILMNFLLRFAVVCIVVLLTAPAGVAAEGAKSTRTALVIGNNRYEAAVGPLRNTVNDAKAMAKTLRSLGFIVIEKTNVTRDELLAAMAQFRAKLRGAEVGLFYFAGHGIAVAGSNYLFPVKSGYNADVADDTTLRLVAETKLFNAEQAVADMSAAGAKCNLVILDACRNTPAARNPRVRDAANAGGLSEMKPPAGSLIAFATDAGRTAHDGDGINGLYTEELLRHLRTPGLSIEQVFKRTRAGVMERSAGAQIPAEYSRLVGDDVFLAGPAPSPPEAEPPVPKGRPIPLPSQAEVNKLAAAGDAERCVEGLRRLARSRGPGDFAGAPLETLLDRAKEDLREKQVTPPKAEAALKTCDLVLAALGDCLPSGHSQRDPFTAKAQNRRGDALLILGQPQEALDAYNAAATLAPSDAYILYNRGRAHLALARTDEAKADFTLASSAKFKQPGARKLALAALAAMK
jgi:tetratricopeptide (TPR) repeat protein